MTVQKYEEYKGGDGRKILSYALFYGSSYEPPLGVESLIASADTISELKLIMDDMKIDINHSWQIVDTSTFRITDAGNDEGITIENGIDIVD